MQRWYRPSRREARTLQTLGPRRKSTYSNNRQTYWTSRPRPLHYHRLFIIINLGFDLCRQLRVSLQMADISPTGLAMKPLTTEIPTGLPQLSR